MSDQNGGQTLVYVGTYTRGESEGIYVYRMDPASGALEFSSKAIGIENPSFLDIDPSRRFLYAVAEIGGSSGSPGGAVNAYSITPGSGQLTYLNQQSTLGDGPCHLSVDHTGKYVLVANYGSGSVCILPVESDGRLGESTDFVQHEGSSVDPQRQQGPHAHSINIDAANRFAFAPDLGIDKVMIYRLDLSRGKLVPSDQRSVQIKAGAGPRHFDFHPGGGYAYVINELDSTVTAFAYDGSSGSLRELQTVSTLPDDFAGTSHTADVHVAPSGRFLYGSNRGHDSIAVFAIDEATGELSYVDREPTGGETPRNFAIDPTGTFLLAANQDTDTIVTFRIDQQTGKLESTGHVAEVPAPVCLKFLVQ
jgi:6-phosphogluconolactonase